MQRRSCPVAVSRYGSTNLAMAITGTNLAAELVQIDGAIDVEGGTGIEIGAHRETCHNF